MPERRLTRPQDIEDAIRWRLTPVPGDRRDPWTRQCAIKANLARIRGDLDAFWAAGVEVVQAHRAALRAKEPRSADAMTDALTEFFQEHQDATPAAAWVHFSGIAEMGLDPFIEFDGKRITFEPAPGRPFADIDREAFMRRARRVKNILSEAGQQHAHVRAVA